MDPKHLFYLSVVLEKGSLTEAAKHLAVTQPTLTRVMSTLEMQAGTTLFSRSRYGVKGTPVGEALAREGRAIQRNVEAANSIASRHRIGLDKELRIGVGPLLAATVMPRVQNRLLANNPNISLSIEVSRPTKVIDKLIDNELDFALAPSATNRQIPGCVRTKVADDSIGIYCSTNHPLANLNRPLEVNDLAKARWLSLGHGSPFEREVMDLLAEEGVSKIRTQVVYRNEGYLLLEGLKAGLHLSVLPHLPMQLVKQHYQLKALELNRSLSQARDIFLWAREEMADHPIHLQLQEIFRAVVASVEN
jgi:DNA-binding transcriptional LysR family regulator